MHKLYDEDDELRREFKDTFSGIHASEALKDHTFTQMLENVEPKSGGGKDKALFLKKKWCIIVPAVALFCAVFVLTIFKGTSGTPYITQLEDGVFCEEVKLEDGELHFVAGRVAISISPNAGSVTIGQEKDGKLPASEDGEQILDKKEEANGGQLIYKKIESIKLPDIGEGSWSYIGEQKIYITVLDAADTRYQAFFEKDGQAYEVTGINVWQKEFIDYLYHMVKK